MKLREILTLCILYPIITMGKSLVLDEMTVFAPVESAVIGDYGDLFSSVSQEQIADLNAFDLQTSLKNIPGVMISKYSVVGNFGGAEGGGVFIRGLGSSRPGGELLTLVDDIPKLVSVWSHPMMDFLNVNVVDRIDVYKGAQPVLFGNSAFAAVNMITTRRLQEGYDGKLSFQYGSFNTFKESLMFKGKEEKWDYLFANTYACSDGEREDADGYIFNATTKLGYELNESWDAVLFMSMSDNYANDPGSSNPEILSRGEYYTEDFMLTASLENNSEHHDGYLKAYYQYGKLDWRDQDETPGLDTITKYHQYGEHLREHLRIYDWFDVTGGFDCDVYTGSVTAKTPGETDNSSDYSTFIVSSPYASASLSFDGIVKSVFSVGARYFMHNEFDSEFAPEAGAVFSYKDTKLAFNYSRGVNYPGLYVKINSEIFMPGDDNEWENLSAETVDHYEASIQQTLMESVNITFSSFFDYGSDRIVVVVPPFPPTWQNIDEFTSKGLELSGTWRVLPGLAAFLGATWIYEVDPYDLPYVPDLSVSYGITWNFLDDWKLVFDGTYMDSYYAVVRSRSSSSETSERVDSYFINNCKLYYSCNYAGQLPVTFSLSVDNVFDVDYEYYPGYEMPGTSVMLGIEMEI